MVTNSNPHFDTVLVEQSDDRLAEVEIAKRTGNAFVSVGTKGSEIVPQDVADYIAYDKSLQDTTVADNGAVIAAHRENYVNAVNADEQGFVESTNEEKAEAHSEYSARLVAKQQEQEARDVKELAEGRDIAGEILARQARLAEDYDKAQAAWSNARPTGRTVNQVVGELVEKINVTDLAGKSLEERMEQYSNVVHIPDALEKPATEALTVKDHIISTEESYADFVEGGNDPEQQVAQVEEVEAEKPKSPQKATTKAKTEAKSDDKE